MPQSRPHSAKRPRATAASDCRSIVPQRLPAITLSVTVTRCKMMRVRMTQRAVGQGGLFSGALSAGGKPLRWLYDCGSNQPDALLREIAAVAQDGDIDLLFVSHLDSDHAGGIDRLLSQVAVREVVLPYLDEATLIAIIARDVARGALSGAFVEAASDLAGWFGSRGVETVTFVGGRDDDAPPGDGPDLPGRPGDGGEGDVTSRWTREPDAVPDTAMRRSGRRAKLRRAQPDAALLLFVPGVLLNWALVPYAHVPPARLMKAFDAALKREFGPLSKKAIVRRAKESSVRERLRECYDALWIDHNLVSMALYAGPLEKARAEVWAGPDRRHFSHWRGDGGGWLLTGDAHLDRRRRRERFLEFYRRFAPLVNVLMLPHHGSIHNHSDIVLDAMPDLFIGYAAAGPNDYGHPHRGVRDAVEGQGGASFHQVSHRPKTRLLMDVKLS